MKKLSSEEAEKVLEDMKVKIEIPKAAVTQWERNTALDMAIEALKYSEVPNSSDCISRQAAIDIERNETVDTNPMHFEAHQKFTQFMDDAEISSFGRWQWSNGFNTALTAVGIDLKKLPSAHPEPCEDAVSRKAVRFILPRMRFKGFDEYRVSLDLLDKLPSVTPKRKTGKWINISDGIFEIVKCDQCGRTMDSRDNFCPRCGSDMTEDSE